MTIDTITPYTNALAVIRDPNFQNEAAQIRAKALLDEILDELPLVAWTYLPHRVVRNAVLATVALEHISDQAPAQLETWIHEGRLLALLWEALAQLKEGTTRETALFNAAINYEIAGYQANASCIAKRLLPVSYTNTAPRLTEMGALFLRRSFLHLDRVAKIASQSPTDKATSRTSLIEKMAMAMAGVAFSHSTQFFLQGSESAYDSARTAFSHAETLYSSLAYVEESNLISSLRSILPVMKQRATWTLLPSYAPDNPRWHRYLKLLARGVGSDIYRGRSISELWPSQIKAIQDGLLTVPGNKIVKMPTSAGKTRIAELAIVHKLVNNPEAKCVYVAPYRALASELHQSFLSLLSDLGLRCATITGTYESDNFQDLLFQETDVLVTTPEKLDLVLRAQPEFLNNVSLFVLDEAQIVSDQRRGIKFELLLTRLKRKLPLAQFLFLSAVVPEETLQDFAKWFNASPQDILSLSWRPSIQRVAKFEWLTGNGFLRYVPETGIHPRDEFVPGIIRSKTYPHINPNTGRVNSPTFPDITNRAQTAADLAFKLAELGPVLVFCAQRNFVESVAKAMFDRLRLAALTEEGLPGYFQMATETRSSLIADEWLGDRPITNWLKAGIGIHHGSLPDNVRNAVETDFRERKFRVIIATNTLAQGVNLPVRTVIIHSTRRYIDQTWKLIPARDYWNIAGRAGRASEETQGLVVHITMSDENEKDFNYFLARRQNVEPVESALLQNITDLVQRRMTPEALQAELDPEILALLVEEGTVESTQTGIRSVLEDTFAHVRATRDQSSDMGHLSEFFVDYANNLAERVSDPQYRAVYSSTGLSSQSCDALRQHINQHRDEVQGVLRLNEPERFREIVNFLLSPILQLSEMLPEKEFSGSYSEFLTAWIAGTETHSLLREQSSDPTAMEECGRLIDQLFAYKLPWGLSAYFRIAHKELEFDRKDTGMVARYFPSMVKFGLPDPIACWAMTSGIPTRRTAIEMAATYLSEVPEVSPQTFREWLGNMTSERLNQEFGIKSPFLEDITRSLQVSTPKKLLMDYTTLDAFLPHNIPINGIRYGNRATVALRAQKGQTISVVRDYDNPADRNAIAVHLSGQEIGYLPADIAQILAPEIDTGIALIGSIVSIVRGAIPQVTISIDVVAARI